jgi:hypothetical protein
MTTPRVSVNRAALDALIAAFRDAQESVMGEFCGGQHEVDVERREVEAMVAALDTRPSVCA